MNEQQGKQPAHTVVLGLLNQDVGRIMEFIGMASRGIAVPISGLFDTNVRISAFVDVLKSMVIPEKAYPNVMEELKSFANQLAGGLNSGIYELRTAHNELVMLCSNLEREQVPSSVSVGTSSMPSGC